MSRYIEISNIVELSRDHFGGLQSEHGIEKRNLAKIRDADTRWFNALMFDEIVPSTRTVTDESNVESEIDCTYLVTHFEAPHSERGGITRDRESWILVDGLATDWLEKIQAAIAAEAALHHPVPEPVEDDGLKITDRGVWLPGETYYRFDLVGNPDDVSEKYLALKESQSTSPAILQNSKEFCSV